MELLYLPLTLYVFFIGSLRTKRLFYFSVANPNLPLGGFANDSKHEILKKVPDKYKPKTEFISINHTFKEAENILLQSGIGFPLIVKPDIGEGGFLVKKIKNHLEFFKYHEEHRMSYLIQEFIDEPMEVSILVHNANGQLNISSITERKPLQLKGNGLHSIKDLVKQDKMARYRYSNIMKQSDLDLNLVLEKEELVQPFVVGNWDYGAKYIERKDLINEALIETMSRINSMIGLFNYARYDIKCTNTDDLKSGRFKILEINGVKGEPIHIYDHSYTFMQAYREIFLHWEYILKISKRNLNLGYKSETVGGGFKHLRTHYQVKKNALKSRIKHE